MSEAAVTLCESNLFNRLREFFGEPIHSDGKKQVFWAICSRYNDFIFKMMSDFPFRYEGPFQSKDVPYFKGRSKPKEGGYLVYYTEDEERIYDLMNN